MKVEIWFDYQTYHWNLNPVPQNLQNHPLSTSCFSFISLQYMPDMTYINQYFRVFIQEWNYIEMIAYTVRNVNAQNKSDPFRIGLNCQNTLLLL